MRRLAGWLTAADRLAFDFGVAVELRSDSSCLAAAFTGQRARWISKPTTCRTSTLNDERADEKQGSGKWRQ
jgi:hypothetical protein